MMLAGIEFEGVLGDAVFLLTTLGFFGLAALFVRACAWIAAEGDDAS